MYLGEGCEDGAQGSEVALLRWQVWTAFHMFFIFQASMHELAPKNTI
jgi:hypothetical protein